MTTFTVALLQMASFGLDNEANARKGEEYCRKAAQQAADVALFPEMWNVGYSLNDLDERKLWQEAAIDSQDQFFLRFKRLAEELSMAIVITYLEKWIGAPRNSASVIDKNGDVILNYAKVHTCEFALEKNLTPGNDFPVAELHIAKGSVRIGLMICYDREFPESARVLMLNGAEVILTPNACPLDSNRIPQFKTRAYENMVGVATANHASPRGNGHSVAFDGIAYGDAGDERNTLLIEAGEGEGVFLAKFDLDQLRDYRKRAPWGNAYRKPRTYSPLVSMDVTEPFVRPDSTR